MCKQKLSFKFKVKANIKLPAALNSNPGDAARNPEDVLDYIPGDCWVRLLRMAPDEDVPSYENLLAVLVIVLHSYVEFDIGFILQVTVFRH